MSLEILSDGPQPGRHVFERHPEFIPALLTNKTGGTVLRGSVVMIDYNNPGAFWIPPTPVYFNTQLRLAITLGDIPSEQLGRLVMLGDAIARTSDGTLAVGEYVAWDLGTKVVGTRKRVEVEPRRPRAAIGICTGVPASGLCRIFFFGDYPTGEDPTRTTRIFCDFCPPPVASATVVLDGTGHTHTIVQAGTVALKQGMSVNSVLRLVGDNVANNGSLAITNTGGTFATLFNPTAPAGDPAPKAWQLALLFARVGVNPAITRYIGLSDMLFSAGVPTNGIYLKFTGTGNLIGVCRAAAVETTVDFGFNPPSTSFTGVAMSASGGAHAWFNNNDGGNYAGATQITSNIPNVALGLNAGTNNLTAGDGLDLDYWDLVIHRGYYS